MTWITKIAAIRKHLSADRYRRTSARSKKCTYLHCTQQRHANSQQCNINLD